MSAIGGGEILRAVMDKSCVYSELAFYCISVPNNYSPARTQFTGILKTKPNTWFLTVGIFAFPNYGVQINQAEYPTLYDPLTSKQFYLTPNQMPFALQNDTLESQMTLCEYILWEPGSTIGVNWRGAAATTFGDMNFVVLHGIEYKK